MRQQKQEKEKDFDHTQVKLTPAARFSAPLGHARTGDPTMNAPWTALGTPAISISMPITSGLPLGLQITSHNGHDASVLQAAVHIERTLHQSASSATVNTMLFQHALNV